MICRNELNSPVFTVGKPFKDFSVIGLKIDLFPKFKIAYHIESLLSKFELIYPVEPGFLNFVIYFSLASGSRINGVNCKIVLISVHPLNQIRCTVAVPIGCSKVLIILFIKIGPGDCPAVATNDSDFYFRVGVAGLGIVSLGYCSVLPGKVYYREERHFRIVEPVEKNIFTIRRPPEGRILS